VQQGNVGENTGFSWLNEDISQGNPVSWSNKPNPGTLPTNICATLAKQTQDLKQTSGPAEIVIQGTPVPLARELHASRRDGASLVPFGKLRASPLCCPSTYSTDQGCVCGL
jgi:hypothetical protein